MRLQAEDLRRMGEIVAERYLADQKHAFVNLRKDVRRIYRAYDGIKEQYHNYPYMSRDWYVANSVDKTHMCTSWDELRRLVEFLSMHGEHFDFMVKDDEQTIFYVITLGNELSHELKNAVQAARDAGYSVYVFRVDVPESIEFKMVEVTGASRKR